MSERLERWNDDAPECFRAAKAAYAQLGPDGEQLERMLARVEQGSATSGAGAPPGLGLGSKAWRWLLPVVSVLGAAWLWTSRPVPAPAAVEHAVPPSTPAAVTPRKGPAGDAVTAEANAAPATVPLPSAQRARAPRNADPLAELVLLDRARRVMAKDPARALALAGEHARDYAAGQFAEERELLAIEALARLGRRAAAERRAQAFRRTHSHSVHEHRLEVILSTYAR
jgi:hypothetical protein